MSEINESLKEFIQKLKRIDVPELLEKAKSLNVEDIRSIKWSDVKKIKKSFLFYPTLGTLSATILTCLILIPSLKSINKIRNTSLLYIKEANELKSLKKSVKAKNNFNKKINKEIQLLDSRVLSKNQLINITRILAEVSQKTSANITEFFPITNNEVQSCSSLRQGEVNFNSQTSIRNLNNNIGLLGESTQDSSFISSRTDLPEDILKQQNSLKNIKLRSARKFDRLFMSRSDLLSPRFNSNYYLLKLNTKYIHAINFLKGLQEFKSDIIPLCFQTIPINSSENVISKSMEIRIYLNVPSQ